MVGCLQIVALFSRLHRLHKSWSFDAGRIGLPSNSHPLWYAQSVAQFKEADRVRLKDSGNPRLGTVVEVVEKLIPSGVPNVPDEHMVSVAVLWDGDQVAAPALHESLFEIASD